VKKAIENNEHKYNLTVEKPKPVNGDFEDIVRQMMVENISKPRETILPKQVNKRLPNGEPLTHHLWVYIFAKSGTLSD